LNKLATRLDLSLSSASLATNSDLEPVLASIAADLPQALHPVPVAFQRRREIAAFATSKTCRHTLTRVSLPAMDCCCLTELTLQRYIGAPAFTSIVYSASGGATRGAAHEI